MAHNPRRLIRILNQYMVWAQQEFDTEAALLTPWTVADRLRTSYREVYDSLLKNPELCEALYDHRTEEEISDRIKMLSKDVSGAKQAFSDRDTTERTLPALGSQKALHHLLSSEPGQLWLKDVDLRECLNVIVEFDDFQCREYFEPARRRLSGEPDFEDMDIDMAYQDIWATMASCPKYARRLRKTLEELMDHPPGGLTRAKI